jgi:hypothetical protein
MGVLMISKDELAHFDPAVSRIDFANGFVEISLHYNTSVLTLSKKELERLLKELGE